MSAYPHNFLRGLRRSDHIDPDGYISAGAFRPNINKPRKEDGNYDISINWEDEEESITITLADTNNSRYGAARVALEAIYIVNKMPNCQDTVSFERKPKKNNPYHGNIIYAASIPKKVLTHVTHALALYAAHIPQRGKSY